MITYLESIRPVHRFFQLIGFSPFLLGSNDALKQTHENRPLLFYSVLFFLLSASSFGYGVAETIKYLSQTKITLYVCTDIVLTSGLRLIGIIMFIESIVKHHSQIKLLNAFYEIDEIFVKKLNVDMKYKQIKRKLISKSLQWCTLYVCIEIGIIALAVKNSTLLWLFVFLFTFPFMVVTAKCMQIVIFVTMLDYRLEKLNDTINRIHVCELNGNHCLRNGVSRWPILKQRYKRKKYSTRYDEMIVLNKVFVLWDLYNRLWECSKNLNYYFQWSLSMNVSLDFISIVTNSYYFLDQLIDKRLRSLIAFLVYTTIGLFHIIRILETAGACHYTAEQVSPFVFSNLVLMIFSGFFL